jgi:hypothetical protein
MRSDRLRLQDMLDAIGVIERYLPADLDGIMAANETKVAAEFDEKMLELFDKPTMQVGFAVLFRQVQEFNEVTVPKNGRRVGMQFCQRC